MKVIAFLVLLATLSWSVPVQAWHYNGCYRGGYGWGYGCRTAIAAGILGLGFLTIGALALSFNGHDRHLLDAAARSSTYDYYLIAMKSFNENSKHFVTPMTEDQWVGWRIEHGMSILP